MFALFTTTANPLRLTPATEMGKEVIMMNKMNYNAPELELIAITDDIITTSQNDKPFVGEDDELDISN